MPLVQESEVETKGMKNQIGNAGAESLAGVLAQCAALAHLNLSGNQIGAQGTERLAGVLGQCSALAHLNLRWQ
jgi:Ran GTPase-activating protein (RanGAP) involved in mRNA processing and transport